MNTCTHEIRRFIQDPLTGGRFLVRCLKCGAIHKVFEKDMELLCTSGPKTKTPCMACPHEQEPKA